MTDAAAISVLSPKAAKMLAVEILLADPESLGDDVLESCLYILRDRLNEEIGPATTSLREGYAAAAPTAQGK